MQATMRLLLTLAAVAVLLGACASVPGADGRYATPGRGGWDSFRAAMPTEPVQLGEAGGGR
jgi:hypothetical protein